MFHERLKYYREYIKRAARRTKRSIEKMKPKQKLIAAGAAGAVLCVLAVVLLTKNNSAAVETAARQEPSPSIAAATPAPTPTFTQRPTPTPTPTPTPDPTLMKGCEDSERVAQLQARLMKLGYMEDDDPTEHFGPVTEYAVQLFQRQHDLQQDGIAGAITLGIIYSDEAKKYTLLEGVRGDDVSSFQEQLKDLGYLSKVTGYYGDETIAAVKDFQSTNRLKADGKAGENTMDLINSDKAKPSPQKAAEKRRKANIDKMISVARSKLGSKYRLGSTGPNTFDCSGFVYYCLKQAGSNRRRLTSDGYSKVSDWQKITSTSKLKKGDLLFFLNNAGSRIGHVGIYIGSGQMIDASSSNGKVVRRTISSSYWKKNFKHALRPW